MAIGGEEGQFWEYAKVMGSRAAAYQNFLTRSDHALQLRALYERRRVRPAPRLPGS
jgi:hypothetical protein